MNTESRGAIVAEPIVYHDEDVVLDGVVVRELGSTATRPGVLVVHGGAGLDEHARGQARRYAELGYVVLAADMYGRGVRGDRQQTMATIGALRADPDRLVQRAQAAVHQLAAVPGVGGGLAAVGYCFGGMAVLELARSGAAVAGVVCVHGSLSTSRPARPGAMGARVLVCHGGSDPHVPRADVEHFVDEMTAAEADWQLNVYGDALHGFTHDADTGQTPGVAYDATADARSRAAIRHFLADLFHT
jgi:dienelactone hydrolase